jgi:lipopolysaccharide/colanic/teichoic acid biosynthesis glycosyltransferase
MHPYSEYLQEYVYEQNKLQEGGKFKDDFRVTAWGAFMRKCWIDELPMLYNWLRGDLKLVGVRPLSQQYLELYTPEHRELRSNVKPGLLPPYYADMPTTLEEIMESERSYIEAYLKNPVKTQVTYFFKCVYNIVIKKRRSA